MEAAWVLPLRFPLLFSGGQKYQSIGDLGSGWRMHKRVSLESNLIRTIGDNLAHIGHFHTAGNAERERLQAERQQWRERVRVLLPADTGCAL